ncbi:hypothetical protein BASA83_008956 [Batrachochytrium salamandrivorans]|nr:hypothetical protein BASA83_008956 [Batrachochytrium salamandrivorans]
MIFLTAREENFAVWSFMATMIENPKRKVTHDAASEQGATQEQSNPNANPEEKPRMMTVDLKGSWRNCVRLFESSSISRIWFLTIRTNCEDHEPIVEA